MTSNKRRRRFANEGCRTSWRLGWRTASSLALIAALGGCGGSSAPPPTLARADAAPLIALAGRIAGEGKCGQARDIPALTRKTIALVNSGRVPAGLQEQLLSGVNDLAAQAPACVRTLPAPVVTSPAPHAPGKGKGKGKGKGHDRHGGREDDR